MFDSGSSNSESWLVMRSEVTQGVEAPEKTHKESNPVSHCLRCSSHQLDDWMKWVTSLGLCHVVSALCSDLLWFLDPSR